MTVNSNAPYDRVGGREIVLSISDRNRRRTFTNSNYRDERQRDDGLSDERT